MTESEEVGRLLGACEQTLLEDGVDAPVAVYHLPHAEVLGDGQQRDRFVLARALVATVPVETW